MTTFIKRTFCKPTPAHCAAIELAEAKLQLLKAHSAREYADSIVEYRTAQILRLTRFVANENGAA